MSKRNVYSSNNSGTSSETSETQSIEENIQVSDETAAVQNLDTNKKNSKDWKPMKDSSEKDVDTKRPPWRAVSLSTLPKPDKNALLRAKLLDASRRLRASKTSIGLQINLEPTKLFRDINLGVQTDLLLHKEVGVLTDGSFTKKTGSTEEYILSYSVAQMTDNIKTSSIGTQTLLPKTTHDYFLDAYFACDRNSKHINKFTELEKKLLQQICEIRRHKNEILHQANNRVQISECQQEAVESNDNLRSVSKLAKFNTNTLRSSLLTPTFSSWNFEYGDIGNDSDIHNIPYVIYPNRPWSSFVPLLSPIGRETSRSNCGYIWKTFLLSIDELINESNRLADTIEDISMNEKAVKGSFWSVTDDELNFKPQKVIFPSEHWVPIINEQENELSKLKKTVSTT